MIPYRYQRIVSGRFPLLFAATALTVIAVAAPEPGEEFCTEQGSTANVRLPSGRRLDCLDPARGVAWEVRGGRVGPLL